MKKEATFWIANLCNRNVSLADLNLTVPAWRSINLLDKKHYSYTLEQLQKSATSGSIFAKRDKIKVRHNPPEVIQPNIPFLKETYIPTRERSILVLKEDRYEELEFDDKKQEEHYAEENAEFAGMDEVKPYIATKG